MRADATSLLRSSNHLHFVMATDSTGRRACYFVQVDALKEPLFLKAVKGKRINFDEYGTIVASCYGEHPTDEIKTLLRLKYNFNADDL